MRCRDGGDGWRLGGERWTDGRVKKGSTLGRRRLLQLPVLRGGMCLHTTLPAWRACGVLGLFYAAAPCCTLPATPARTVLSLPGCLFAPAAATAAPRHRLPLLLWCAMYLLLLWMAGCGALTAKYRLLWHAGIAGQACGDAAHPTLLSLNILCLRVKEYFASSLVYRLQGVYAAGGMGTPVFSWPWLIPGDAVRSGRACAWALRGWCGACAAAACPLPARTADPSADSTRRHAPRLPRCGQRTLAAATYRLCGGGVAMAGEHA